jgi:hypothetical protein
VIGFLQNRLNTLTYLPSVLDPTVKSQYNTTTLFVNIFENIMVEEWTNSVSYSSLFTECNPSYCTYSNNERPHILVIITTLISVFSGLNIVLKLFIPLIIRVVYWCWGHANGIKYIVELLCLLK